jgi:beta-phosphoglucomutase
MIKGLFFDLDGTLLLTDKANYIAYRDALEEFNLELTPEAFKKVNGKDSRDFLKSIFPKLTEQQVNKIRSDKAKRYLDLFGLVEANTPVIEILKANQDKITAIVTNAKSLGTYAILDYFELSDKVTKVLTGDLVSRGKPSSEIYFRALKECELNCNEVIAFEDSNEGVISARGAGIAVIKVPKFKNLDCQS